MTPADDIPKFTCLSAKKNRTAWTAVTTCRVPRKPLLLLAIPPRPTRPRSAACAPGKVWLDWTESGSPTAVLLGTLVPVQFLISFEFLILAAAPSIVGFILLNGWRYGQFWQRLDAVLLGAWLSLGLVIGLYFLYYLLDVTPRLWAQGIWFSENDVLHLGLIAWMVYIGRVVLPHVRDLADEANGCCSPSDPRSSSSWRFNL